MRKNEGTVDRVIRVFGGLCILSLVFVGPQSPWAWLGALLLASGLLGYCPVYNFLGMRTRAAPSLRLLR